MIVGVPFPPIKELKEKVQAADLWNLILPENEYGVKKT